MKQNFSNDWPRERFDLHDGREDGEHSGFGFVEIADGLEIKDVFCLQPLTVLFSFLDVCTYFCEVFDAAGDGIFRNYTPSYFRNESPICTQHLFCFTSHASYVEWPMPLT